MLDFPEYCRTISENFRALATLDAEVLAAADLIKAALRRGGKVMFCGNGGSAADCQHLAAELMGRFLIERAPMAAIALTVDTSALTAIGNDYSHDDIFSRQVRGLGREGDVLVGVSTSGNSRERRARNGNRHGGTHRETGWADARVLRHLHRGPGPGHESHSRDAYRCWACSLLRRGVGLVRIGQAAVLISGRGAHFGSLARATPKPLLEVGGRPFLEHVIGHLTRFGVSDIVLLAGFQGQVVADRYEGRRLFGAAISVIVEPEPLGTGGAVRHAAGRLAEQFLLCDGESFLDADLVALLRLATDPTCGAAMLLRMVGDAGCSGLVEIDEAGRVRSLREKTANGGGPHLINSGTYALRRDAVLAEIAEGPCSLEGDVFPRLVERRALSGIQESGYFVDIVSPDDLAAAQTGLERRRLRPAAFLDRDGVINRDEGYTHRPDQLEWIEGAPEAIRSLNEAGFYVFVVTNQAGVARGFYTEADIRAFHAHMQDRLLLQAAHVDGFYYCPHHPDGVVEDFAIACRCRKPGPGLLEQAAADWPIDRTRSFLIGDKDSDMAAAAAFGIRAVKFEAAALPLKDLVAASIVRAGGGIDRTRPQP